MRVALAAAAVLVLAACAPSRPLERSVGTPPPASDASWSFEGRVAVSDGKDSGSARVSWTQDGERYRVTLRAPVSGETWRLSGDAAGCVLEGVHPGPVHGDDPEELLQRELGWRLPIRAMKSWVRGLHAVEAPLEIDVHHQVPDSRVFRELGWTITYRDWFNDPVLPKRIEAEKPPYQVRLAIAQWN